MRPRLRWGQVSCPVARSIPRPNRFSLFAADFQTARCLWNSEVEIILNHRMEMMQKDAADSVESQSKQQE